jgi:ABC transporter with metal-binding/Fe-S-binding domain ATP-binding protein
MKLAALCSGGKDSTFSIYKALQIGHTVECIVTIHPSTDDSMLFHYPNSRIVKSVADAMQIPFVGVDSRMGSSKEEECQVLVQAIKKAKLDYNIEGIVHGTISSRFQNDIFRNACSQHGLANITPLWNVRPYEYLQMLIDNKFLIKIVSVSAAGLDFSWLGRDLTRELIGKLAVLSKRYGINISFEGGEAETLTMDCPIFKKKLSIKSSRIQWDRQRGIFEILDHSLLPKEQEDA